MDFLFQSYDDFISEYNRITGNSQKTGYQEAPYGYDSVWAIANMLKKSMNILRQNGKKYLSFNLRILAIYKAEKRVLHRTSMLTGPSLFGLWSIDEKTEI